MIPSLIVLPVAALLAAAPVPPAPAPESLVLIVANNRGTRLDRSPLQYADDDGAKYHAVFSALAGAENTVLLTDFDADTAGLFPSLTASTRSPTLANVQAAARDLALRAARGRSEGRAVHFYFVFAGHGDVDEGRGFLELSDGPFTADQLLQLLRAVGASEGHVILDSCNSFFVVNPRKAGGHRFATPRDTAERLARRLPDVGVFLSTSAQAEVYEWSELQSGVFSHAVRSGLMGAADADHDGRVSYLELAAFVETASADIKNPLFRPRVFARGPNGEDARPLFSLPRSARAVLVVDEPGPARLAMRDREGLRWLDAFKEPDDRLELWFPGALDGELEIQRLRTPGGEATTLERRYVLSATAGERLALAGLAPASSPLAARGVGEIFRALFARPFGPVAYGAWLGAREPDASPIVLGDGGEGAAAPGAPVPSVLALAGPRQIGPDGSRIAPSEAPPAPGAAEPMDEGSPEDAHRPTSVQLRLGGIARRLAGGFGDGAPDEEPDWESIGFDGAVAVARAFRPWLEGELAVGHHSTESAPTGFAYPGDTYYGGRPLTPVVVTERVTTLELTGRLLNPAPELGLYAQAGVGLALAHVAFEPTDGNPTLRTTRLVPEAHVGFGARKDFARRWFAGAEARLSFARVEFVDRELGLEGLRFGALLGRWL